MEQLQLEIDIEKYFSDLKTLEEMRKKKTKGVTIVHINKNLLNTTHPCRVETEDGKVWYCKSVKFLGNTEMKFKPDNPRPCGARLWLETGFPVEMEDPKTYSEVKK